MLYNLKVKMNQYETQQRKLNPKTNASATYISINRFVKTI